MLFALSRTALGGPLERPLGGTLRGPLAGALLRCQLHQQRAIRSSLSGIACAVRERLGLTPKRQQLGAPRGAPWRKAEKPLSAEAATAAVHTPQSTEISTTSQAVERHLLKVYKNPTPEELHKRRKKKTTDPVFFRQLHAEEFEDYRLESRELLRDKSLCFLSPRQSAARELPLQKHLRTPAQKALHNFFGRHREYPQIAWQMIHIILERVENQQFKQTFGIPDGFNGVFYTFILHLWLLHVRLMQQQKSQRSSFFGDPCLPPASASVASAAALSLPGETNTAAATTATTAQMNTAKPGLLQRLAGHWLPQKIEPLTQQQLKAALTRRVYGQRLLMLQQGPQQQRQQHLEAPAVRLLSGALPTPAATDNSAAVSSNRDPSLHAGETDEALRLAVRIAALRNGVSGEIINDYLFKQTWGLVIDWLRLKKVGQFQIQAELKNCQAYAFGLMVSLDQAMTEGEIFPARIKEALWGNVYSGEVGFGDKRLCLLTKYTIRQLLHVLQLSETAFFQAKFTWADFPLSPHFLEPPLMPALSLPVSYGGFKPAPTFANEKLLEPGASRSKLIS